MPLPLPLLFLLFCFHLPLGSLLTAQPPSLDCDRLVGHRVSSPTERLCLVVIHPLEVNPRRLEQPAL